MFVILAIVAGLTGTVFMSLVMWFIHERGWANADMIRAVGSLVTRRYDNALLPGLLLHVLAGCIFAVVYLIVMRATGDHQLVSCSCKSDWPWGHARRRHGFHPDGDGRKASAGSSSAPRDPAVGLGARRGTHGVRERVSDWPWD
jgi:hypothetical protein